MNIVSLEIEWEIDCNWSSFIKQDCFIQVSLMAVGYF